MYRASYCNVYINQRDAHILVIRLYFFIKWLYMFRTIISPSSGATFNKQYSAIGTFVPVRLAADPNLELFNTQLYQDRFLFPELT